MSTFTADADSAVLARVDVAGESAAAVRLRVVRSDAVGAGLVAVLVAALATRRGGRAVSANEGIARLRAVVFGKLPVLACELLTATARVARLTGKLCVCSGTLFSVKAFGDLRVTRPGKAGTGGTASFAAATRRPPLSGMLLVACAFRDGGRAGPTGISTTGSVWAVLVAGAPKTEASSSDVDCFAGASETSSFKVDSERISGAKVGELGTA